MWDLFQENGPFDAPEYQSSAFSNEMHLACIISLLGPPPLDLIRRGKESSRYFDDEGTDSETIHLKNNISRNNSNNPGTGNFKFPELVRETGG